MELRRAAGSLLVVGLEGTSVSALEQAWLKVVRPGGIILFRRNIHDPAQTRALLEQGTLACAPRAFRCVDVEGGTVDRLRDALAAAPSAQAVAIADRNSGTTKLAFEHGELIGRGVRAFGFNVTLAPVLDLALPDSAQVMGTRSTGATADQVIAYARPFLAGLASQSIRGCAKHFPGLGAGARDSHFETPRIHRAWNELWSQDLAPYRALRDDLPMVMVNHAAYPETAGKDAPATASAFWITRVLRQRIGYRGLVFSDDMEMGGILKAMPMEQAAVAAIRAGMETLEICHSPELILRAYESLLSEAERSTVFRALLLARARDAARKRARMFAQAPPRALTPKQFTSLQTRMQKFRDKVNRLAGAVTAVPRAQAAVVETA